jgi:ribosomal protein L11 methyltransferase
MTEASSVASASGSSASGELQRLTVTVAVEDAESLGVALADLAPSGWCERPYTDGATVELWLPASRTGAATELALALGERGIDADVATATESDDWRDGLRRHHKPIEVGGKIRVRPPWTEPREGLLDIVIDPGMAFGTGQHATTKGCLTLLIADPGGSLLDVGCGSGVLAIAAHKLGYGPVWAIDNDPLAIEATLENAGANGVSLEVGERDADRGGLPAAQTLVANITANPVIALVGALADPLPRRVILSGFRPADVERVSGAWAERGYRVADRFDEDNWTALRLTRG